MKDDLKDNYSITELIEKFNSGDDNAFNKIINLYKDKIFNLCYRIINNYDDANDVAQETFIKVYKNLSKFKFNSTFSTWIYRIAVNTCKTKINSKSFRQRKQQKPIDIKNDNYRNTISDITDEFYSPEKEFDNKEKRELIFKVINKLPKEQKIIIVLRDIEKKSYDEIAEITNTKLGTIKSKLARTRILLQEKLKGFI